jgi:hypothetical protein
MTLQARRNAMLKDEIKTDVEFLKKHDLQPKWWKIIKVFVLAGIVAALVVVFDWMAALLWFGTVLVCMGGVHFMYRIKTKKYTAAWADFRVDPKDKKRKFGLLYYPLVAGSFALAFVVMMLVRGGWWK